MTIFQSTRLWVIFKRNVRNVGFFQMLYTWFAQLDGPIAYQWKNIWPTVCLSAQPGFITASTRVFPVFRRGRMTFNNLCFLASCLLFTTTLSNWPFWSPEFATFFGVFHMQRRSKNSLKIKCFELTQEVHFVCTKNIEVRPIFFLLSLYST